MYVADSIFFRLSGQYWSLMLEVSVTKTGGVCGRLKASDCDTKIVCG